MRVNLRKNNNEKLDGLGTFYPTVKNVKGGLASLAEAKQIAPAVQVDGIHVRFEPEGAQLDDIISNPIVKTSPEPEP